MARIEERPTGSASPSVRLGAGLSLAVLSFVGLALVAACSNSDGVFVLDLDLRGNNLDDGAVNTAYSGETLEVRNAVGTVTLTIVSGSLPTGMSFSGMDLIGTPTTGGTYNFRMRATDSGVPARSDEQNYSLDVDYFAFDGTQDGNQFGFSVSGAGDVDNDGFQDMVIGEPFFDTASFVDAGRVLVISGRTGTLLIGIEGTAANQEWGQTVDGAGDVNMDGFDDVIVGSRTADVGMTDSGFVRIYSGADGSILNSIAGTAAGQEFGTSVAGAGDTNLDGYDDYIVGAPLDDTAFADAGIAILYSGFDHSVLWTFMGGAAGDLFGASVDGGGDVNRDGFPDVVIGAPGDGGGAGSATVYSGADGSMILTQAGQTGWQLGFAVAMAGDLNLDGFEDLALGAPTASPNGTNSGLVRFISGRDDLVLSTAEGQNAGNSFGSSVSAAGNLDGDNFPDVVVGAPGRDSGGESDVGRVVLVSGSTATIIQRIDGNQENGRLGTSVAGIGDTDGDGYTEFLLATPTTENNQRGRVVLVSGRGR